MNYIISDKQVKLLSEYLSFKPHREVNNLLYMLDKLPPLPEPKQANNLLYMLDKLPPLPEPKQAKKQESVDNV